MNLRTTRSTTLTFELGRSDFLVSAETRNLGHTVPNIAAGALSEIRPAISNART